jgi:hypothetical protein
MKKIVAIVLLLILPCFAAAEQDSLQIDGEWYGFATYTNMNCRAAELREDGCFYVKWSDGEEIVFYDQGQIDFIHTEEWTDFRTKEIRKETETETINMEFCRMADDSLLFYDVMDREMSCYYLTMQNGEWIVYSLDSGKMLLFLNGRIIHHDGGDTVDYLVSGSQMYMTQGDKYIRGTVRPQGDFAFVFDVDADPWIETFGEIEVDYGTPYYLFVSTSIGK